MLKTTPFELIAPFVEQAESNGIKHANGKQFVRFLWNIDTNVIPRFFILLIAVSLILSASPVLSTEKPEDKSIFLAGFEAYQKGDYVSANKNFMDLFDKYPDTPLLDVALFWSSRTYYKMGNQREAARYMSQLMKQYPDTPLRGYVEDELLELVSRFEKGDRLPSKTDKTVIPGREISSEPTLALEKTKRVPSVSAANVRDYRVPVADSNPPAPNPIDNGKTIAFSKLYEKPTVSAEITDATANPASVTPAEDKADRGDVASAPTAKNLLVENIATQAKSEVSIKGILVGESFIDIVTGTSLKAYKATKLTQPDKLVIDIAGAKSAMAIKSISINRFGISNVRIGTNRASVRIVLDAAQSRFPAYDIKPFESGLRITINPLAALVVSSSVAVPIINKSPLAADSKHMVPISMSSGISKATSQHGKGRTTSAVETGVTDRSASLTPAESGSNAGSVPPAPTEKTEQTLTVAPEVKSAVLVKGITVGKSYIDIITGSDVSNYKDFKLLQPDRLVIDIPGAKNLIATKSISINRLGISKVRIGISLTTVRIVLDAAHSKFPDYVIKPIENGIRINIKSL